jgi:mRNA-degrading endonuclease RelE of RelBE toxin-antitoxin system
MTYSVDWMEDALIDMALIWANASDSKVIYAIQDHFNDTLAANPRAGREKAEDLWVIDHQSIRIQYEIDDTALTVTVVSAALLQTP